MMQTDNDNLMNIVGSQASIEILDYNRLPQGAFLTQPYSGFYKSQEDAQSMTQAGTSTGFNAPAIMLSTQASA
jgi:hypothetical protein